MIVEWIARNLCLKKIGNIFHQWNVCVDVTCERVLKASVNIKYDWNRRKEAMCIHICDLYESWKVKEDGVNET